jgi:hypothetical protein
MKNNLRFALGLCIALLALSIVPKAARASDACAVTPGLYQTTWERMAASTHFPASQGDVLEQLTSVDFSGDITFDIACDGTVTIKNPNTSGAYEFKSNSIVLGKNVDHKDYPFTIPLHFAAIGKAKAGFGGFPTLTVSVQSDGVACPAGVEPIFCPMSHTEKWTFKGTRDDSDAKFKTISGHLPFNGASMANASTMDPGTLYAITHTSHAMPDAAKMNVNKGVNFGAQDGYTMVLAATPPDLLVSQDIESVFLETVPSVTIELRAHVYSWGGTGAIGKDVTFDFEGKHFDVPASQMHGPDAIVNVEVGNLHAGPHIAIVSATNAAGQTTKAPPYEVHIIPTPPWARKLSGFAARGIDPHCVTECVYYSGNKNVPEKPIAFGVDIPAIVPFIGGPWGIRSTQFTITPKPQSRLGPSTGSVSGGGQFGLGGKVFDLAPASWSNVTTTTTPTELQFTHGNIGFSDQDVEFTKHLSFLEVFASLGDVLPVKGVGNWIRQNDGAGIDVGISGGVHKSSLQFAAKPSDPDISISKFETELSVTASVKALIDLKLLGGGVLGLVNGTLDMSLEPSPKVESCKLQYYLVAVYGSIVTGYSQYPANPAYEPITSCASDATASVGPIRQLDDALAAANRASFFSVADAATPPRPEAMSMPARDPSIQDRLVQRNESHGVPSGRRETTVVDGVPAFVAAPAIAAGPHGHLALVWIGENRSVARPQAWQTRLRIFDGRAWKASAAFVGDGRPNALPSVAFDGDGNIVIAYSVNATKNASPSIDAATQFANLEVEVVVCDATTGRVKARRTLSAGKGPHINAHLVTARDGSVWAAWETVASSDYGAQDAASRISVARWNRHAWSPTEIAVANVVGVRTWQLAARDGATATIGLDAMASGSRTVRAYDRSSGGWRETFTKAAAPRTSPRIATGYAADGSPEMLWADGDGIVREQHGVATSLAAHAAGVPVAISDDPSQLDILVETPNGFRSLLIDERSGRVARAGAIAAESQTLSAPSVARSGNDWILATARVPSTLPMHSLFGGGPLSVSQAAPAKAKPMRRQSKTQHR